MGVFICLMESSQLTREIMERRRIISIWLSHLVLLMVSLLRRWWHRIVYRARLFPPLKLLGIKCRHLLIQDRSLTSSHQRIIQWIHLHRNRRDLKRRERRAVEWWITNFVTTYCLQVKWRNSLPRDIQEVTARFNRQSQKGMLESLSTTNLKTVCSKVKAELRQLEKLSNLTIRRILVVPTNRTG